MAVRLKYAGIDESSIVVQEDIEGSLDAAVAAAPGGLFALPTYTALIELQDAAGLARARSRVLGLARPLPLRPQ